MKWYGIVAILVLFFGLAGIVYLGINTEKIEEIANYDCDKKFKEYVELFEFIDPTESINSKSPARMAIYELEDELRDYNCPPF